jgi:hypothetical protein
MAPAAPPAASARPSEPSFVELVVPEVSVVVEATGPAGAQVAYSVSAHDDQGRPRRVNCKPPLGSTFPIGQTKVTCDAIAPNGTVKSDGFQIEVKDSTGPIVRGVVAEPADILYKDRDKEGYVTVRIRADVSDAVDPAPKCQIDGAESNRPVSSSDIRREGKKPIFEPVDDASIRLLAEPFSGMARIYTIGVTCADKTGNLSNGGKVQVTMKAR